MPYRALLSLPGAVILVAATCLAAAPRAVDYEVTPLTKTDIDFYLGILRAAAAHNAHLEGDDKEAVALSEKMQKHPSAPVQAPNSAAAGQTEHDSKLLARAARLASYDETIARQRGASRRYDGIKGEVERVVAALSGTGAGCGGAGCGGPLTAAQIAHGKQADVAIAADKPLIAPHQAEIVALKEEIGGFMFGRAK